MKTGFQKPAKTYNQMIQLLTNRGMIVDNIAEAEEFLAQVNYYRLSGYWFGFQDKSNDKFIKQITFNNIVDIYRFDTKLRSLCLDVLEKIEIAIHTIFCDHLCNKYSPYWFNDKNNIQTIINNKTGKEIISKSLIENHFLELVNSNKNTQFIREFQYKYTDKLPPYWILAQIVPFGSLSKLYTSIQKIDRQEIANKLNVPDTFLMNSLKSLSYVRNICAHYSRLYNRHITMKAPSVTFKKELCYQAQYSGQDFYSVFYLISYFLHIITPKSKWCVLVKDLIDRYSKKTYNEDIRESLVSFKKMGFPEGWEELPLFKEMLQNK